MSIKDHLFAGAVEGAEELEKAFPDLTISDETLNLITDKLYDIVSQDESFLMIAYGRISNMTEYAQEYVQGTGKVGLLSCFYADSKEWWDSVSPSYMDFYEEEGLEGIVEQLPFNHTNHDWI